METGKLTPRTNNTIEKRRYTGGFGQPDGFKSVLFVSVTQDGKLHLTLQYKTFDKENVWSVDLTNEQRNDLSSWIGKYQPTLVEVINNPDK